MVRPSNRWLLWALLTLSGFTALEVHALRRQEAGGTLSEVTRAVLGITPNRRHKWVMVPAFVLFLSWVGVHILTQPLEVDHA